MDPADDQCSTFIYGLTSSWTLLFHTLPKGRGGPRVQTPTQARTSHPRVQINQQEDQNCRRGELQHQPFIRYMWEYHGEFAFWNSTGKTSSGQTGLCSSVCNTLPTAIPSLDREDGRYYKQTYTAAYHNGVYAWSWGPCVLQSDE